MDEFDANLPDRLICHINDFPTRIAHGNIP